MPVKLGHPTKLPLSFVVEPPAPRHAEVETKTITENVTFNMINSFGYLLL